MVLGPVITDEQHPAPSSRVADHGQQRGGDIQRSNGQVLTATGRGTTSQQRSRLLTTSGRTVCRKTSKGQIRVSADPPAATSTEPAKTARQKPLDECVLDVRPRCILMQGGRLLGIESTGTRRRARALRPLTYPPYCSTAGAWQNRLRFAQSRTFRARFTRWLLPTGRPALVSWGTRGCLARGPRDSATRGGRLLRAEAVSQPVSVHAAVSVAGTRSSAAR